MTPGHAAMVAKHQCRLWFAQARSVLGTVVRVQEPLRRMGTPSDVSVAVYLPSLQAGDPPVLEGPRLPFPLPMPRYTRRRYNYLWRRRRPANHPVGCI